PKTPTLPRLLKEAGYATAHFGKWHLGHGEGAPSPREYGIEDHRTVDSILPGWDEPDTTFRAKSTASIVDETLRFIRANRDRRFYVNLWTLVPHAPLVTWHFRRVRPSAAPRHCPDQFGRLPRERDIVALHARER